MRKKNRRQKAPTARKIWVVIQSFHDIYSTPADTQVFGPMTKDDAHLWVDFAYPYFEHRNARYRVEMMTPAPHHSTFRMPVGAS